jgi:hypothetical protein
MTVFINCPFDEQYNSMLKAMIFTFKYYGFKTSISSDTDDCMEDRLTKITKK